MDNATNAQVWFITGSSTGFGRVLTEHLLATGHNVVATARKPGVLEELVMRYPAQLLTLTLDVTSQTDVDNAVKDAIARFDHIDVLVNNAGYGVVGAVEEVTAREYMPMFETNVFGLLTVTQAWLPHFRQRRAGTIVNLSSIGGLIGGAGFGFYNATKFAVEGLSQALRAEVEPLGMRVLVVEPGPFRTDFLGRSGQMSKYILPDYTPTAGNARTYMSTQDGKQPGDPQRAVEAIVAAVNAPRPPKNLLLGKTALTRYRTRLKETQEEVEAWAETTAGADFPEAG